MGFRMSIVGIAHIGGTQYAAPPRPAHQQQAAGDPQPAPIEGGRYVRSFSPVGAGSLSSAYQAMRSFEARAVQAASQTPPAQVANNAAGFAAYAETATLSTEVD